MPYRNVQSSDWIQSAFVILIYSVLITVGAIYLLPNNWGVWLISLIIPTGILVFWQTKTTGYQCPHCKNYFSNTFWQDVLGMNAIDKKYLTCPKCGHKAWMKVLIRTN